MCWKGDGPRVALLDLGAKRNIARSLNQRGCQVTVYPALTAAEEIIAAKPDGIMLSNGPGDPKECVSIIQEIRKLYETDIPIFAICLGHQLMALATGADTHKMKYGHRGGNHPVKDLTTGRVYISSQKPRLCGGYGQAGSPGGGSRFSECKRRYQRGTFLYREKYFHSAVPPGGLPGPPGFGISV